MTQEIKVGISDLNVVGASGTLVTYALGSCVGICLYDKIGKIAGMSHILLPSSVGYKGAETQPHKFADTAIPSLIKKMEARGAKRANLTAKIAGGAKMFAQAANYDFANIGARNVESVKKTLMSLKIPIVAEDTGLDYGRTQYFSGADGIMTIKSANRGVKTY